jgi:hypothetical protein
VEIRAEAVALAQPAEQEQRSRAVFERAADTEMMLGRQFADAR